MVDSSQDKVVLINSSSIEFYRVSRGSRLFLLRRFNLNLIGRETGGLYTEGGGDKFLKLDILSDLFLGDYCPHLVCGRILIVQRKSQ